MAKRAWKVGDRYSIMENGKRRHGVIAGIKGVYWYVRWDDGEETQEEAIYLEGSDRFVTLRTPK